MTWNDNAMCGLQFMESREVDFESTFLYWAVYTFTAFGEMCFHFIFQLRSAKLLRSNTPIVENIIKYYKIVHHGEIKEISLSINDKWLE